jgi:uncharacterized protein
MERIFVDTGAWYALIDRKDPDHHAVLSALQGYRNRLVTSNFVFDETITLLRYRLGWHFARQFGEQLLDGKLAQLARISAADERNAWAIFTRYDDKSFSFTDCTSFAVMQRLQLDRAIAIDSDFRAYGLHCLP